MDRRATGFVQKEEVTGKFPRNPPGIEIGISRLVAQYLNRPRFLALRRRKKIEITCERKVTFIRIAARELTHMSDWNCSSIRSYPRR